MRRVFITGANRGIGLAVVARWLETGALIFAACRQPSKADDLQALQARYPDKLHIVPLEVRDDTAIQEAFERVKAVTAALDVLINNAAINPHGQDLGRLQRGQLLDILNVNTVAPVLISQTFAPLLKAGAPSALVHITSEMAALTYRDYGGDYGYCASKAALNMMMRGLAADLRRSGVITIALDPGWVQTDMGGSGATLTPQQSAAGIIRVIEGLRPEDNGKFLAWDGSEHPW